MYEYGGKEEGKEEKEKEQQNNYLSTWYVGSDSRAIYPAKVQPVALYKDNPAARVYIGMSAAAERDMSAWILRLNMRGTGGVSNVKSFYIFHGFQVVRSRN